MRAHAKVVRRSPKGEGGRIHLAAPAFVLLAFYGVYIAALGGLIFPPVGDETHFWYNAVAFFGHSPLPSPATLRSYPELNTPLPFVVWGTLEYWLHQGVWLPRAINLAMSFGVVALIAARVRGGWSRRTVLSAGGLLLCPYYLFVSARIYTDMPAIFCAVFGLWAYLERRHARAALLFMLAIACRQYAVAFPLGILGYELAQPRERRSNSAVAAAAIAVASLAGWVAFFGAIAPPAAIEAQAIATASLTKVIPQNALYLLACTGLYFAVPASILSGARRRIATAAAPPMLASILLVALFAIFPPVRNVGVPTETMGLFDRVLHALDFPSAARVVVLCGVAVFGIVTAWPSVLARSLMLANAVVMIKGHEAWDKYALPLVAALWLLTSRDDACDSSGSDDRCAA